MVKCSPLQAKRPQGLEPACSPKTGLWDLCSTARKPFLEASDTSWDTLTPDTADGAIGGTAQKIGGPLDKEGSIGQHFNSDGKIGSMVQENLADKK